MKLKVLSGCCQQAIGVKGGVWPIGVKGGVWQWD